MSTAVANAELYGLDDRHLINYQGHQLEPDTAKAFAAMQVDARKDGIEIAIYSAYRSFDRQRAIWNAKATGKRQLLDRDNRLVSIDNLTKNKLIDLILIWSAIPGASRHHWGTDIDIFDSNKMKKQEIALITSEYQSGGAGNDLSLWLKKNGQNYQFYLPFQEGLSGVSPEPWHISFYPKATEMLQRYRCQVLADLLKQHDVILKQTLLSRLESIVAEYVFRVARAPQTNA